MNTTNLNLQLTISGSNDQIIYNNYYMINNDTSYELMEEKMPFIPTSMNNDRVRTRMLEKVKFEFAIMSENKPACVENFKNLNKLIELIKPRYVLYENQYTPSVKNFTGLFKINFRGMPSNRSGANIHLTQFSYRFDKDMGFIENNDRMIPISYIISLEGNLILNIEKITKKS